MIGQSTCRLADLSQASEASDRSPSRRRGARPSKEENDPAFTDPSYKYGNPIPRSAILYTINSIETQSRIQQSFMLLVAWIPNPAFTDPSYKYGNPMD